MFKSFLFCVALFFISSVSCATVVEVIAADAQLSTLNTILNANPALKAALSVPGENYVVFAPINAALNFQSTPPNIAEIISHHYAVNITLQPTNTTVLTVGGSVVKLNGGNDNRAFANLSPIGAVTSASNGVVIKINTILITLLNNGTVIANTKTLAQQLPTANLNLLSQLIGGAGLTDLFSGPGDFTVLAPADQAFVLLGMQYPFLATFFTTGEATIQQTQGLLSTHVLPIVVVNSSFVNGATFPTLIQGVSLTVANERIEGASILIPNILATNGILHIIDRVLLKTPPIPQAFGVYQLTKSLELATTFNLVATLGAMNLTVFAPVDQSLPQQVSEQAFRYHFVDGPLSARQLTNNQRLVTLAASTPQIRINKYGNITTVNGVPIVASNNIALNGFIHIIPRPMPIPAGNVIDVAKANNFNILAELIALAGLNGTLSNSNETLTVFAPTDAAFNQLGTPKLNELKANITELRRVLLYHVVQGVFFSVGLTNGEVTTLNGETITVQVLGQQNITVEGVPVAIPDVVASNGAIHVVGSVLMRMPDPPTTANPTGNQTGNQSGSQDSSSGGNQETSTGGNPATSDNAEQTSTDASSFITISFALVAILASLF